jgi:hypothetical protein
VATRQNINAMNVVVNTQAYDAGVYLVEVTTAKGKVVEKITIK